MEWCTKSQFSSEDSLSVDSWEVFDQLHQILHRDIYLHAMGIIFLQQHKKATGYNHHV